MTKLSVKDLTEMSKLADQLRDFADQIEARRDEDELIDGSLSVTQPGVILVFDEACNEERLRLSLRELVDGMLEDNETGYETGYETVWKEWAHLFADLSKRIDAAVKNSEEVNHA